MEEINLEPTAEEEDDYYHGFICGLISNRPELLFKQNQAYLDGYKAGVKQRLLDTKTDNIQ